MLGKFRNIASEVHPFLSAHPECRLLVGLERADKGGRLFCVYADGKSFAASDFKAQCMRATWHEYVIPDRPVKLYFDVEDKKMREGWDELLRNLFNCVCNAIGRTPRMIVGDATIPEKLSHHLIFPDVWFDNPASLATFARRIVHPQLGYDDRVDMQVYSDSPTVYKSLRTMYSPSAGKNNPLLPKGGPAEFDEALFLDSLVTQGDNIPDASLLLHYDAPARVSSALGEEDTNPEHLRVMENIEKWIALYWCVDKVELKQRLDAKTGRWVWHVRPGLWCPIKKRRHLSNNTMVRGTIYAERFVRIETYCLDEHCCQWLENRDYDWSTIAYI